MVIREGQARPRGRDGSRRGREQAGEGVGCEIGDGDGSGFMAAVRRCRAARRLASATARRTVEAASEPAAGRRRLGWAVRKESWGILWALTCGAVDNGEFLFFPQI